jgi:hypothetical protein
MGVPNAKRTLLRAFFCALPAIAPAFSAEFLESDPAGIVSETVIANLGSQPAVRPAPVPIRSAIRGNPLWSVPLTSLAATRDRPVFSPSRRPPPPPVVAAPYVPPSPPPPASPAEPDHPLLTLLGTVAGETGGVGIFMKQNDKAPVNLRIGEDYQGWVLRSVRGRETIFEKNNRTAMLALPAPEMAGDGHVVTPNRPVIVPSPATDPDFWNR